MYLVGGGAVHTATGHEGGGIWISSINGKIISLDDLTDWYYMLVW